MKLLLTLVVPTILASGANCRPKNPDEANHLRGRHAQIAQFFSGDAHVHTQVSAQTSIAQISATTAVYVKTKATMPAPATVETPMKRAQD